MPSPASSPSIERIEKSKHRKEQDPITVVEINDATRAELAKNTKEISKQNKKWKKSFGSTSATSPDGTMDITTAGVKLEKENMEVTF
jgi:ribosomal protein L9